MTWDKRLSSLVDTIGQVATLARRETQYHFYVPPAPPTTFYLDVSGVEVRVLRHNNPLIEVKIMLQSPFAWRLATDQDAAGVYVVARRRPLIGSLAQAIFDIVVPRDAHLILKLENCRLTLENNTGTFEIPGQGEESGGIVRLNSSKEDFTPPRRAQLPGGTSSKG